MGTRNLPLAHWKGNVYRRRFVDGTDGRRLEVIKISGSNAHATCSQVAAVSTPRGWKRALDRPVLNISTHKPVGYHFEPDGHGISWPIRRVTR